MTDRTARKLSAAALAATVLAGAGIGAAGYLRVAPQADEVRRFLRSDGGAVLFEHARHAEDADGCVVCHHDLAGEALACADCHDDPDLGPADFEHDELREIHDDACADCHDVAPDDEAASCRDCHDEDLAAVYHAACSACHLETAPDRFADDAGEPLCRACHLR